MWLLELEEYHVSFFCKIIIVLYLVINIIGQPRHYLFKV